MTPKNDYLILEIEKTEDRLSSAGIVIPSSAREDEVYGYGTVIASSNEEYSVGDRIFFNRWTPYDFAYNGKDCVALQAKDVIAVL